MDKPILKITDTRTSKDYEVPIQNATIRAMDLRQVKEDPEEFGMMTYDPGYTNTASCTSRITYIDGEKADFGYFLDGGDAAQRSGFLTLLERGLRPAGEAGVDQARRDCVDSHLGGEDAGE